MSSTKVTDQGKHLNGTMNGATRITSNANTILQQPDINLDHLPDMPKHQQTARDHCNSWLKNVWPAIIDITADIIDYANTFQGSYDTLTSLVDKLKSGDKKAKQQFSEVLKEILIPALEEKKKQSNKVAADTTSLKTSFQGDYNNFANDSSAAKKAYTSKGGEIQVLQKKIDTQKALVHTLSKELIIAAVAEGLLLIATAVIDVATEDEASALFSGLEAELDQIDSKLMTQYASAMSDLGKTQSQMAQLKDQLAYLNTVEHELTGFANGISDTVTASQDVANGWTALGDDLSKLVDQLEKITPEEAAVIITTQLNIANKDWGVVLQQAKVLQPSGQIPVKHYKGMQSFLDDITPKQGA